MRPRRAPGDPKGASRAPTGLSAVNQPSRAATASPPVDWKAKPPPFAPHHMCCFPRKPMSPLAAPEGRRGSRVGELAAGVSFSRGERRGGESLSPACMNPVHMHQREKKWGGHGPPWTGWAVHGAPAPLFAVNRTRGLEPVSGPAEPRGWPPRPTRVSRATWLASQADTCSGRAGPDPALIRPTRPSPGPSQC